MKIDLDKVPITITEALEMFLSALDDDEKKTFSEIEENQIAIFHHTLGQDIRNEWSMWEKNTPLVNNFKEIGITHADDMSSILLTSAHRQIHKKPIELKEQVDYYQKYWNKEIGKPMP